MYSKLPGLCYGLFLDVSRESLTGSRDFHFSYSVIFGAVQVIHS